MGRNGDFITNIIFNHTELLSLGYLGRLAQEAHQAKVQGMSRRPLFCSQFLALPPSFMPISQSIRAFIKVYQIHSGTR